MREKYCESRNNLEDAQGKPFEGLQSIFILLIAIGIISVASIN